MKDALFETFGKYFMLHRVALGGMAEIYLARPANAESNGRVLVLKRILPEVTVDPEYVKMFQSEIQVTMGFSHPNLVQIYDFGKAEGKLFIAMEYIEGKNLRELSLKYISMGELLPIQMAASLIAQSAMGLHYAHAYKNHVTGEALDIVHRDISPQNILVSYDGQVKIIDFGIAKTEKREEDRTKLGCIKGKLSYLSPEQLFQQELDGRSDIFSLGTVLWELLAGQKLFHQIGTSDMNIIEAIAHCENTVVPPSRFNDLVPPELDRIVLRALRKERGERYQTAEDFGEALQEFLQKKYSNYSQHTLGQAMKDIFASEVEEERRLIKDLNHKAQRMLEGHTSDEASSVIDDAKFDATRLLRQNQAQAQALAKVQAEVAMAKAEANAIAQYKADQAKQESEVIAQARAAAVAQTQAFEAMKAEMQALTKAQADSRDANLRASKLPAEKAAVDATKSREIDDTQIIMGAPTNSTAQPPKMPSPPTSKPTAVSHKPMQPGAMSASAPQKPTSLPVKPNPSAAAHVAAFDEHEEFEEREPWEDPAPSRSKPIYYSRNTYAPAASRAPASTHAPSYSAAASFAAPSFPSEDPAASMGDKPESSAISKKVREQFYIKITIPRLLALCFYIATVVAIRFDHDQVILNTLFGSRAPAAEIEKVVIPAATAPAAEAAPADVTVQEASMNLEPAHMPGRNKLSAKNAAPAKNVMLNVHLIRKSGPFPTRIMVGDRQLDLHKPMVQVPTDQQFWVQIDRRGGKPIMKSVQLKSELIGSSNIYNLNVFLY